MNTSSSPRFTHAVKVITQATLVIIPVVLTLYSANSRVFADPSLGGGDGGGGASRTPLSDYNLGGGDASGTDSDTTTLFRAPKDNTRHRWKWSPEKGWQLDIVEETYENGWIWVWRDGWQWEQSSLHGAAGDIAVVASSVARSATEVAQCFDVNGALTTEADSCATNQKEAALKSDPADLPEQIRAVVRDTAPYIPGEEATVLNILRTRFDADVVSNQKASVVRLASDVVNRLGMLKDLDSVTDTEKEYFVAKIAEAQRLLSKANHASSRQEIATDTSTFGALVKEVHGFVTAHGITSDTKNAPTAAELLADAHRIIKGVPAAFSALDDAGYSTMNLRSMHDQTLAFYADVSLKCSQGRDCSRVGDVIDQLSKTVTTMNDMVFASGDSTLKAEVQKRFDEAVPGR